MTSTGDTGVRAIFDSYRSDDMRSDDHPVVRRMVRSTLRRQPHFEVCDEAEDGAQAVEKAREVKPDDFRDQATPSC